MASYTFIKPNEQRSMSVKQPEPPTTSDTCTGGSNAPAGRATAAVATTLRDRLAVPAVTAQALRHTLRRIEYVDDGMARYHCLGCGNEFTAPDHCAFEYEGKYTGWRYCPLCGVRWEHVMRSSKKWDRIDFNVYRTREPDWWWVLQYKGSFRWQSVAKFSGDTPAKAIYERLNRENRGYFDDLQDGEEYRFISSSKLTDREIRGLNRWHV